MMKRLLKSRAELDIMDRCNRLVVGLLRELSELVRPGMTTGDLERHAEKRVSEMGVRPAFKGYRGYPAILCTSVNEVIVHGIPGPRVLAEGDILSLDLGLVLDGYFGDAAVTVPVGRIGPDAERLIDATRDSLTAGIAEVVVGNRVSDISHAVETAARSRGFSVIEYFVGHGIGYHLHEEPQVPNYGPPGKGMRLQEGLVIALEPMICIGDPHVTIAEDNWTARTAGLSAHFEYSVAVTKEGPRILGT